MDETKEILTSILHQLERMNAKIESLDTRIQSLDKRQDRMETDIKFIRGTSLIHDKILTDHNHRIADIEQELRISGQQGENIVDPSHS